MKRERRKEVMKKVMFHFAKNNILVILKIMHRVSWALVFVSFKSFFADLHILSQ